MTIDELFELCKAQRKLGNGHKEVFVAIAPWPHGSETKLFDPTEKPDDNIVI